MRSVKIIMNGVTGRMGTNQHLIRSILAIRAEGGILRVGREPIWPEPILVGRDEAKLEALARSHGLEEWTTSLEDALDRDDVEVYFDSQSTQLRSKSVRLALEAAKHVYCEKPLADDLESALELTRLARAVGVKTGVVQDKLFLPGLRKLKRLVDTGFFGTVLSIRGEFGYWVVEDDGARAQRPSWNYRKEEGGGVILDMFPHWRYLLDHVIAPVRSVMCLGTTHIPARVDEKGATFKATADDAAYAVFELEGGVVAQLNSSWAVRVYRDDLAEFQVDGTNGSAVVGLRTCRVQPRTSTPRPVWNPDQAQEHDYRADWVEFSEGERFDNAFKVQWQMFLRHVVDDEPYEHGFLEGAKGVQLAEIGLQAWRERRWLPVPELEV